MATSQDLNVLVEQLRSGSVPTVDVAGQPIRCASVYETARSQAELYLLTAGQKIPAHEHSAIDDVFVGLRGRGRIRIWNAEGDHVDQDIEPGWVVVVEPGDPHEVSCNGDEFCYVLTQSPKDEYDSVSYSASNSGGF